MIITRDELNKIKELNKLEASSTLLKIIQSAEEFGAIDGRKERQEANTIALRKVLTDCGFEVEGMGFGDMLYELRKTIMNREGETSKEPKVLAINVVDRGDGATWGQLALKLADLIEPEPERTCEILHDDNLSEQYGGPMARCSYCGAVLPEEFIGPYYYCPCCGSKNKVVCDAN